METKKTKKGEKIEKNKLLFHLGQKTIKTAMNQPEKEKKPGELGDFSTLNKEQLEKHLSLECETDIFDNAYEPESDPNPIVIFDSELDSVEDLKAVDLVFLVDTTGSMNCFLKGIKRIIRKIMWDIEKCLSQFIIEEVDVLKIGLVTYKDHGDEEKYYLTKVNLDLTSDSKVVLENIMGMTCGGGKDEPEAVLDGISTAFYDISWRDESVKFLYHILDAPCHGKKYNKSNEDKLEGCPNNIDIDDILTEIRNKEIKYSVIKLNDSADQMLEQFQQKIKMEVIAPKVIIDKSKIMGQE